MNNSRLLLFLFWLMLSLLLVNCNGSNTTTHLTSVLTEIGQLKKKVKTLEDEQKIAREEENRINEELENLKNKNSELEKRFEGKFSKEINHLKSQVFILEQKEESGTKKILEQLGEKITKLEGSESKRIYTELTRLENRLEKVESYSRFHHHTYSEKEISSLKEKILELFLLKQENKNTIYKISKEVNLVKANFITKEEKFENELLLVKQKIVELENSVQIKEEEEPIKKQEKELPKETEKQEKENK